MSSSANNDASTISEIFTDDAVSGDNEASASGYNAASTEDEARTCTLVVVVGGAVMDTAAELLCRSGMLVRVWSILTRSFVV